MVKIIRGLVLTALVVSFTVFGSIAKAADPIRIPVLNWSSQIVTAHVMKQAWEEMGYEVELVPAESATRYARVPPLNKRISFGRELLQLWHLFMLVS